MTQKECFWFRVQNDKWITFRKNDKVNKFYCRSFYTKRNDIITLVLFHVVSRKHFFDNDLFKSLVKQKNQRRLLIAKIRQFEQQFCKFVNVVNSRIFRVENLQLDMMITWIHFQFFSHVVQSLQIDFANLFIINRLKFVIECYWSTDKKTYDKPCWNFVRLRGIDFCINFHIVMNSLFDFEKQYLFEKNKTFCGTFRIPLYKFKHEDFNINPRQLNVKNVKRLQKIFELKRCLRLKLNNYIFAFIFKLLFSNLSKLTSGIADLIADSSMFDSSISLIYLHDKHRIKTVKQHLALTNKWWVINIYVKNHLNSSSRVTLRSEF